MAGHGEREQQRGPEHGGGLFTTIRGDQGHSVSRTVHICYTDCGHQHRVGLELRRHRSPAVALGPAGVYTERRRDGRGGVCGRGGSEKKLLHGKAVKAAWNHKGKGSERAVGPQGKMRTHRVAGAAGAGSTTRAICRWR